MQTFSTAALPAWSPARFVDIDNEDKFHMISEVASYLGSILKPSLRIEEVAPNISSRCTNDGAGSSRVTVHGIAGASSLNPPH